jgi:protein SCO1/2
MTHSRPHLPQSLSRSTWTRLFACALAPVLILSSLFFVSAASAQLGMQAPKEEENVDVIEKIGDTLPLSLTFTNADDKQIQLGSYFNNNDKRPVLVLMVYFECPVVCDVLMERLATTINELDLDVGKDYEILVFSFDPTETVDQAKSFRENYLAGYNREVTQDVRDAWQFHVSKDGASAELANALGFKYKKLENGHYSHPVCLFVMTPEGKISRYVYGFSYPARDVKLALIEASEGRLAKSIGDRLMAFCYMYDPAKGTYSVVAFRVMQIGGAITFVLLTGLITTFIIAESIRRKRLDREADSNQPPSTTPMPQ